MNIQDKLDSSSSLGETTIPEPVRIEVPASKVVNWSGNITIREEVYDWLLESAGWGDKSYWPNDDVLEFHLQTCLGRTRCGVETYPCRSEGWGWTLSDCSFSKDSPRQIVFIFRHPSHAILFKLAWGGE